jgi:hypothetical protein
MPTPGEELSSLDFGALIGGPLIAVVNAQAQAALTTVEFIKSVGFVPPQNPGTPEAQKAGTPATVSFTYKKTVPTAEGGTELKDVSLTVPLLSMLPIPYIRVDSVTIEFLAKINSVEYRQVDENLTINTASQGRLGFFFAGARLKVNTQYQKQTKEGATVTRDYSMRVNVKAVQEAMPGGLEKLLSILESGIKEELQATP